MDMGKVVLGCVGVVCVTALGVAYFYFIRQDGSALLTLTGAVGAVIGYVLGKRK